MANDNDSGTTTVQKLLTYALIGFIAYIYFIDRTPDEDAEITTSSPPAVETPVFLSVQHLFGDKQKDVYKDFDEKITVEFDKNQMDQLVKAFEDTDANAENFPVIELEYIEGLEGIAAGSDAAADDVIEEKPKEITK